MESCARAESHLSRPNYLSRRPNFFPRLPLCHADPLACGPAWSHSWIRTRLLVRRHVGPTSPVLLSLLINQWVWTVSFVSFKQLRTLQRDRGSSGSIPCTWIDPLRFFATLEPSVSALQQSRLGGLLSPLNRTDQIPFPPQRACRAWRGRANSARIVTAPGPVLAYLCS